MACAGENFFVRAGEVRTLLQAATTSVKQYLLVINAINQAMKGNQSAIVDMILSLYLYLPLLNQTCNGHAPPASPDLLNSPLFSTDSDAAVVCADGDDISGKDLSWWKQYLDQQLSASRIAGAFWATIRLRCAGWNIRPNWEFKGPFNTPAPSTSADKPEEGRPAAPFLYMAGEWSANAPLSVAREMAKQHPGSGLIIKESFNHDSGGLDILEPCAREIFVEYFDKGVVPKGEKRCPAQDE